MGFSICDVNKLPIDLGDNDFNFAGRLKGKVEIDANEIKGIGTFAYVIDSSSLNLPSQNDYVITNYLNAYSGDLLQVAQPFDDSSARMATRMYSKESDTYGEWKTYDNEQGVTEQWVLENFSKIGHKHVVSDVENLQNALDVKEDAFAKNTAFNKNFGTTSGSVAEGNDQRILNGEKAFTDGFMHEYTGGIHNGSENRTNQSWFDYAFGGNPNYSGIVASFDGLSSDYRLEISGEYSNGMYLFARTRNGDTGLWNPLRMLWHDGNFNPSNYATTNEVNNIYDQLSAKANTRLSNLVYDLSETEKSTIKDKIGISQFDIDRGAEAYSWGDHRTMYVYTDVVNGQSILSRSMDLSNPTLGCYDTYMNSTSANKPSSSGGFFSQRYFLSGGNNYVHQTFVNMDGQEMYFRVNSGNETDNWIRIWHDKNLTKLSQLNNDLGFISSDTTYTASNGITIDSNNVIKPTYGTTANTIAQGNDTRILNGNTAYSWGNHANAGYLKLADLSGYATQTWVNNQLINKANTNGSNVSGTWENLTAGDANKLGGKSPSFYADSKLSNLSNALTPQEKTDIQSKLGLQNFDGSTQFVVTTSNDQLITMTKKKAIVRVASGHSAVRINAIQSAGVVLKVVANSSIVVKIPNVVSQLSNGTIVANGTEIALSTNQVALFEYLDESATFFVTKQSLVL